MIGVVSGFAIITAVVLIGYLVSRAGVLGEHGRFVLGRTAFFALTPCLLFTTLAEADVRMLFSSVLVASLIAAVMVALLYLVLARGVLRRPASETVIGMLASAYVNAGNIGIPIAAYVLGDPALSAPVILLQVLVFAPIALTVLDALERGRVSVRRIAVSALTNPIVVPSVVGVAIAASGIELPEPVMEPFRLMGAAAVPVVLIAFGMSLHGQRPLAPGSSRRAALLASALKLAVMPAVAWAVGLFVFHLAPPELFAVTVLAALPTAQNVFNYAQRYERGEILARDTALISTVLSLPALVVVAALLAPR